MSPLYTPLPERLRSMAAYTGLLGALCGLLMLASLVTLAFYPHEAALAPAFLVPGVGVLAVGLGLWALTRPRERAALSQQDAGVVVVAGWILSCVAAALPLMQVVGLTFTQAVFEAVSGFTTTGLSVVDVTTAPRTILVWRSLMQLVGGAGLAIIMLAAIAGPSGTGLSGAEGRSDQLAPHVRRSATLVLSIYGAYAVVGTVSYRLAGMDWFDAVNHAFAAISTGGFSTRPESIGYWNSPAVEMISIPLMIAGNLNFLTAYLLLSGRWRAVLRNSELLFATCLGCVGFALLWLLETRYGHAGIGKAVRVALFESVSALTTTGFSTVSYVPWRPAALLVMLALMLVGGGTGSTAGGLKQYRVLVLLKSAAWEVRRALLPRTSVVEPVVWMGEGRRFLGDTEMRRTAAFACLYLATFLLGTLILAACGYTLSDSLFEFASSLGTVGLSVGVTSASTPPLALWTQTVGMLLGRLEFFIIFISLVNVAGIARRLLRPGRTPGGRREHAASLAALHGDQGRAP